MLDQIDAAAGPCDAGPLGMAIGLARRARSSTGTSTVSASRFGCRASTIVTGRYVDRATIRVEFVAQGCLGRVRCSGSCGLAAGPFTTTAPPRNRATSSSGRCVADSPMRWMRAAAQRLQALERQRQVRAALGGHQRVDLVDDDRVNGAEHVAGARGEQQVERLGRRDEQVGRVAAEAGALGGRRVARPHRHRGLGELDAERLRRPGDPGDRRPEVALDVHRERLQRRDVEDAAPAIGRRHRREHQPVDGPQERRERLAAAGGRQDQRGLAPGDRRPPERLGSGRLAERRREPVADGRVEEIEGSGGLGHPRILPSGSRSA